MTKTVACTPLPPSEYSAQQAAPTFPCSDVLANIDESLFIIDVTDTNQITPFAGSVAGTSVTLAPGTYTVTEDPNETAIEALIR